MSSLTSAITIIAAGDNSLNAATSANGAALVSSTGQLIATIGSVNPIGAIATAPGAAAVTLMKITLDVQTGSGVQFGDIVSVLGNMSAFIGGVAFFIPGGQLVSAGATVAGNVLNSIGVSLDSNNITNAFSSVYNSITNGNGPGADGATLQNLLCTASTASTDMPTTMGNLTSAIAQANAQFNALISATTPTVDSTTANFMEAERQLANQAVTQAMNLTIQAMASYGVQPAGTSVLPLPTTPPQTIVAPSSH